MFDYTKWEILDFLPESFFSNPLLNFSTKLHKTGELGQYWQASYKGLLFEIHEPTSKTKLHRMTISGSLHKFWNDGLHNHNDFGLQQLMEVRNELKNLFGIDFENCRLRSLEIGINLIPPIPLRLLLRNCLMHKTTPFKKMFCRHEGQYMLVQHQQYACKLYNKSKHSTSKGYTIPADLMRFEIKYLRMKPLNDKGVYTMADLIEYGLDKFEPVLLKMWNEVIFFDTVALKEHPKADKWNNQNYWISLHEVSPKNYFRERYRMEEAIQIHADNLKKEVSIRISNQVMKLTIALGRINTLYIRLNTTLEPSYFKGKTCPYSGLNIEMQKSTSRRLSTTGLQYYAEHHFHAFEIICEHFGISRHEQIKTERLKRCIRESHRHQTSSQSRLYPVGQPLLFNVI